MTFSQRSVAPKDQMYLCQSFCRRGDHQLTAICVHKPIRNPEADSSTFTSSPFGLVTPPISRYAQWHFGISDRQPSVFDRDVKAQFSLPTENPNLCVGEAVLTGI